MIGRGKTRHYDPEDCFNAWLAGGSLAKAVEILYNQGVTDTRGNKPPLVSVRHSSNLYMINNLEESRSTLIEYGLTYLNNQDEWNNFIIRRAKNALQSEKRWYSWLVDNGFLDAAKAFGLVPADYGQKNKIF